MHFSFLVCVFPVFTLLSDVLKTAGNCKIGVLSMIFTYWTTAVWCSPPMTCVVRDPSSYARYPLAFYLESQEHRISQRINQLSKCCQTSRRTRVCQLKLQKKENKNYSLWRNVQKRRDEPLRSLNVFVTMNVHIQLKAVATLAAEPRILPGRISPIINHGMGPNPNENPMTKITKQLSGNQPSVLTSEPWFLA